MTRELLARAFKGANLRKRAMLQRSEERGETWISAQDEPDAIRIRELLKDDYALILIGYVDTPVFGPDGEDTGATERAWQVNLYYRTRDTAA